MARVSHIAHTHTQLLCLLKRLSLTKFLPSDRKDLTVGGHIFWKIRSKLTLLFAILEVFAQIKNEKTRKRSFQIILPSDVIIAVEVEHMVPGSLQKLPICFCFRVEQQNATEM